MGAERVIAGAVELAAETSVGRTIAGSSLKFAEELAQMPVRMFRVLKEDGRGPYSNFNWADGGHLPRLTPKGWIAGKPIAHTEIPAAADPGIKTLLDNRAGMGEGIYLSANPLKWSDRTNDRVFEAFLRDREDRRRLGDLLRFTSRDRIFDDYLLSDFNARGKVSLVRELDAGELRAIKEKLGK
jgi:hypothetical protein